MPIVIACPGHQKNVATPLNPSNYLFSFLNCILINQETFQTNSAVHSISNIFIDQWPIIYIYWSKYYAGIEIFNRLPCRLTSIMKEKAEFVIALRRYLNIRVFYSADDIS